MSVSDETLGVVKEHAGFDKTNVPRIAKHVGSLYFLSYSEITIICVTGSLVVSGWRGHKAKKQESMVSFLMHFN